MWFANFFIASSMTMVIPFLSLYIETLGNYSDDFVQKWSGWVFAITFFTAFIVSPIWGRFGDRHGRKKFLMIAGFGLGICVFLMGFVTNVYQLFILRFFMGFFSGFISMSQAFISTQTPKHIAGKVLGTLQTGNVTGSLLGPLIGGVLADSIGYAATFQLTSITLFAASCFVLLGIKEIRVEKPPGEKANYSSAAVLKHIIYQPVLVMVMVVSMFVQIANFSIQPILSLYVDQIHGSANIAFFSGIAFSAAGLGNLFMSRSWGKLADRVGYEKIIILLVILSALFFFPGALVTDIWQLIIVRFLLGMAIGGIIPLRTAYIRQVTPLNMQGEVLGYNTSIRFLGNIIGPIFGGWVAGLFSISAVFYFSSAILLCSGAAFWITVKKQNNAQDSLLHS
ncbi:Predicted arabinose efflux permease, MFS family [Gracilibacillus ureilyticus]|uniref:Predicted arabinose efflux permease, MFS family n=1 Tax=Gracilibacillus ureilyticus TaxID=531814 RepID=A0A1H9QLI1_9BACI|nr:MFS transporter [Gracilibacillus ureilyticus]SER61298.1 Predicted arabinose efflux permease, MFS family [Gracilibacillus ureilyticus]